MDILERPTLDEQRQNYILNLVNRCLKGSFPQYFKHYFKRNNVIHAHATRQSNYLYLLGLFTIIIIIIIIIIIVVNVLLHSCPQGSR